MGIRATDGFNRADASPLGSPWSTPTGGGGGFKIVSNQVLGVTAPGDNFTHYDNDTPPADHYCKIKFVSTENAGGDADDGGPCVRFTTGGNGYLFNVADNSPLNDCTWWLFSLVAGVGTVLNAGAATGTLGHRLTAQDIIECRCVGSTISGWINGVQIASATDTTYPSGGGYGLHAFEGGGVNGKWDDFEGGDFVTAGPGSNIVIRGGRGVNLGPAGRRMAPQKFPDTIPFVQDGSSIKGPFRRGMGPRMRFRLAQRFPDNSVNAYSLSVVSGTYVLSGIAAPLQHNDDLVATTGTYVVTGNAATLEHGYLISPAKGAYVLTGMAVTFSRAYVLSAATGVYSLTGVVLNLIVGRLVSAASGAYVLAGISDSFLRGYTVAPSSGPYTLVGNTATLTYSGATASPSPTQNPFLASAPKMMNRR